MSDSFERIRYLEMLAENTRLRADLVRALQLLHRLGSHTATATGCPVCQEIRSFGIPLPEIITS